MQVKNGFLWSFANFNGNDKKNSDANMLIANEWMNDLFGREKNSHA